MKYNIQKGFTLMELMIIVAIIGIISAIAMPSYLEYIKKGKRTDAKVELLRIAQLQESYFVQNLSYAKNLGATTTTAGGLGLGTTVESEQGEYGIIMSATKADGTACTGLAASACTAFTIMATPQGGQSNDTCFRFTFTNTGVRGINTDATTASTDAALIKKCWK